MANTARNKRQETSNRVKSFTDLFAWKVGHQLVLLVYRITKEFPKEELFGLVNQMRRCAVSITSNIAEGFNRRSSKEKVQFYAVAQGSVSELQSQLLVAKDVGYISSATFTEMANKSIEVHKLLTGLIKKTRSSFAARCLLLASFVSLAACSLLPAPALAATISRPVHNSGLIGYWSFDLGKGGLTAYDMSGQGSHGTLTGMDAGSDWVDGQVKTALDFDGSNDEVNIDDAQNELSGGTAVTVSAWVYLESYGDSGTAEIRQIMGDDVSAEDGTVAFRVGSDGTATNEDVLYAQVITQKAGGERDGISGATELSLNQWYHAVFTWEQGGQIRLYVDGVLDAVEAASSDAIDNTPSGTLFIGDDETRSRNWHGKLDEVRIYNRALSAQEIARLYRVSAPRYNATRDVVTEGLVGHWTFDGANTDTNIAYDVSGQGNAGTLTGGPTQTIGRIGQALSFDGDDAYINVSDAASLDFSSSFSIVAWVYPTSYPLATEEHAIVAKGGDGETSDVNHNYLFTIDYDIYNGAPGLENVLTFLYEDSSGNNYDAYFDVTSDNFPLNTWHLVAGVFDDDANTVTAYVNGVPGTSESAAGVPVTQSQEVRIGDWGLGTKVWDGKMDDVRIYNRVLSAEEVQRIYNAGAPSRMNRTPTNRFAQGLIGHWSFDGNETDGTKTYDVSGAGNHGTLVGGPTQTIGRLGQALHFDGSDDYVSLGSSSIIGSDDTFTISAWVKSDDWHSGFQSAIYGEFNGENNTKNYFGVIGSQGDVTALTPGQLFLDQFPPSGGFLGSTLIMDEGQWYHVVGVENGSTRTIYINGELDSTSSTSDAYSGTAPNSVRIGNRPTGNQSYFFEGAIDDVRIYDRPLTADEVTQLYNMGS